MAKAALLNGLTLAYMGDAAYETEIRLHLIEKGLTKPNHLHREATSYVSAKAQASIIVGMLEASLLDDQEEAIYKRGRNAKSYSKAKNADLETYSKSTGFEALMGYLYLSSDSSRFDTLCQWSIEFIEEKKNGR